MREVAFVVAVCTALSGCGYKLVRYGGALGDVDSVAIETLANESYEPDIEYIVANAFRREFLRRGAVRLTDASGGADLVLSGSVLPVETAGFSLSSVVLAIEYQLTLSLAIQATRKNRDEALRRFYQRAIAVRRSLPALSRGDFTILSGRQDPLLVFARSYEGNTAIVAANRTDEVLEASYTVPSTVSSGALYERLTDAGSVPISDGTFKIQLAPRSVHIYTEYQQGENNKP